MDNTDIPIHGRKALNKLEGEEIVSVSTIAGGGVEIKTESGKYKFEALMGEITIELWED